MATIQDDVNKLTHGYRRDDLGFDLDGDCRDWFGTADAQSAAAHTRQVVRRETWEEFKARVKNLNDNQKDMRNV